MLLEIKNLKKEYERDGGAFHAVDGAELSVAEGDFVGINGPSGSGKSTLLNMIAGLLEPTSGSIVFGGRELVGMDDNALSLLRNNEIGVIPQGQSVLTNLSVLDNVLLPFYFHKKLRDAESMAHSLLDRMGIQNLADAYPLQLSGGELRRTAIARSLINSPKMLLADEPTVDLDPKNAEEVMRIFCDISRDGTAVILVSHEEGIVRRGNRHFFMESGRPKEVSESGAEFPASIF
ncbi:MAG: ABC transporter ATP-binding protein [Synergistaceae bacterium]|jgi:putative ABC transport system ATP-binding protein|nr:ABC transporter ATP-binding protein [Synergistaceae bacterium]